VTVPPILHDMYDQLTPRTPEEQQDIERERARLTFKLRCVTGLITQGVPGDPSHPLPDPWHPLRKTH
jgi:hypothetical protein